MFEKSLRIVTDGNEWVIEIEGCYSSCVCELSVIALDDLFWG